MHSGAWPGKWLRVHLEPPEPSATPTVRPDTLSKFRRHRRPVVDSLLLDLRFAIRSLRRRPTFAAIAIATIALSIAAATSIYSVVDGVLFRSLPYHDARRLVAVWQTEPERKKNPILARHWDRAPLDYTDFIAWRTRQRSFDAVGVWSGFGAMVPGAQGPEQLIGSRVSPGLLELLGAHPVLGRTFLPGEDVPGGPRVTMLSYETWLARYGARSDAVGTFVRFDDVPYEIIGVLPRGFTLERGKPGAPYWIPAGQREGDIGKHNRGFHAIGRLRQGVTVEQASIETKQLLNANDPTVDRGVRITGFGRDETREVRAPLLMLLGAVGLLVLIACVNIATLLLGEAATRDVEMSARIALGATRMRIVRQLLTESLLLSTFGAAIGATLAWWGTKAIVALAPPEIPGILRCVRRLARPRRDARLGDGDRHSLWLGACSDARRVRARGAASLRTDGARPRPLQRAMIATELALSVVLLVGAALLSRSLEKLSTVDPGFRADHLLVVHVSISEYGRDTVALRAFYTEALARLGALPGVVGAAAASNVPFTGGSSSSPYLLKGEGDAERKTHRHEVQQRVIEGNYFATMGIPLIAGRAFAASDRSDATPVAIISETAARRDFPNSPRSDNA